VIWIFTTPDAAARAHRDCAERITGWPR